MDTWTLWVLAVAIAVFSGFVKGAIGFAMPMILISGLGSFLAPEVALAMLILPTLVSNIWQVTHFGLGTVAGLVRTHWRYLAITLGFIMVSAQLFTRLPGSTVFLVLGVPVLVFALIQLVGWRPQLAPERRRVAEIAAATVAGLIGGISGIWGPPTLLYLTALNTPKAEQMQVTGLVFGLGSVALVLAHSRSGVLNAETWPLSAALIPPVLVGMALGFAAHDRMDQRRFRQATLALLVVAGMNLIRRGLTG